MARKPKRPKIDPAQALIDRYRRTAPPHAKKERAVVPARQLLADAAAFVEWCGPNARLTEAGGVEVDTQGYGTMTVSPHDWVVKTGDTLEPVKPTVFGQFYIAEGSPEASA